MFGRDRDDLHGGRLPAPRAGRIDGVRPLCLQRDRQLHSRLGDAARLRHPDRGHGVRRDSVPERVLGAARPFRRGAAACRSGSSPWSCSPTCAASIGVANSVSAWSSSGALVLELVAIAIGLVQFFDAHKLVSQVHLGSAPTWSGLIFALTVTTIAFTSVESASGLAGEVKAGRGALRRLIASGTATVVLAYVGIAIVAVTALPLPNGSVSRARFHRRSGDRRAASPPSSLALPGARLLDRPGCRRHLDRRRRLGDAGTLATGLFAVHQPPDP